MKNKFVFLIVPFIALLLINAFIPKPKNDHVGGILGRMFIEQTNDWKANPHLVFKAGIYYDVTIALEEKNSNKRMKIRADKNGYFAILNLNPGLYEITECNIEDYHQGDYVITAPHFFKNTYDKENKKRYDEKIKRKYGFIMVSEKQITVLNPLIIKKTTVKSYSDYAYPEHKYEIDYDYESVINNFKEKDKNNRWADFVLFKHDEEKNQ